jgi:sugar phosphate permease
MQWTAVILCAAAIAINYLDRSTIAIANPQIRAEFHMSAAQFGALQSAWSLAYALAQIPVGLLIDRLGPGILLGISMILWSVAVAAGGLVGTYSRLFILGDTPRWRFSLPALGGGGSGAGGAGVTATGMAPRSIERA